MKKLFLIFALSIYAGMVLAQTPSQFVGLLTNSTDYTGSWASWYASNGTGVPGTYSGPAYGAGQLDPIYGVTYNLAPANSDPGPGTACGPSITNCGTNVPYSKVNPWSVDGHYYAVGNPNGWVLLYDATTTPYTFIRRIQISGATNAFSADGSDLVGDQSNWNWSRSSGTHLILYTGCSTTCGSRNQLKAYDPVVNTSSVVHDFTSFLTANGAVGIDNEREGENSDNDNIFAYTALDSGGTQIGILVYNKTANTVVYKAYTGSGNLCTYTASGSCNSAGVNYVTVSPLGDYILTNWEAGSGHDGAWTAGNGTEVFNASLAYIGGATGNNNHGDVGYDLDGNEVFVQQADQFATDFQFHMLAVAKLSSCTSSTVVGPTTGGGCQHYYRFASAVFLGNDTVSMRATGLPGYGLISFYGNGTTFNSTNYLLDMENVAMQIEWSVLSADNTSDQVAGSPNPVWRLGRTHSVNALSDYYAQGDGVPNINFSKYAFSSSMDKNNPSTTDAELPVNYFRYQAYYANLPIGTFPVVVNGTVKFSGSVQIR